MQSHKPRKKNFVLEGSSQNHSWLQSSSLLRMAAGLTQSKPRGSGVESDPKMRRTGAQ